MSDDTTKKVNDAAARRLQRALMDAVTKQIEADQLGVSASVMAVAERLLARYNMDLEFDDGDDELTEDQQKLLDEFKELSPPDQDPDLMT